jgi:hypothetical protein
MVVAASLDAAVDGADHRLGTQFPRSVEAVQRHTVEATGGGIPRHGRLEDSLLVKAIVLGSSCGVRLFSRSRRAL